MLFEELPCRPLAVFIMMPVALFLFAFVQDKESATVYMLVVREALDVVSRAVLYPTFSSYMGETSFFADLRVL